MYLNCLKYIFYDTYTKMFKYVSKIKLEDCQIKIYKNTRKFHEIYQYNLFKKFRIPT